MGTNQIESIGRTKKLGPTINEHRNEKTYLKNWNLGALWKKSELLLVRCWKETNKEGFWQKGKDKRVRLTGFWLKAFWLPMKGASLVEWRFWCLNEWPPMRESSPVEWGFQCLKEESVWVFKCESEWFGCLSEFFETMFESVRVTSEIFESVFEWFWSFRNRVFVTRVYNRVS